MHVVSLHREVRLHLSIAFESQLSSLCIRFALTLHREVRLHLSIAFESQLSSLCIRFALTLRREVRLHLSIASESQLSSLCIRFALTLHLLSEAASEAPQMKKQYSLFIHSAFFDILLQKKVRQVGLSETRGSVVEFYHTAFATEPQIHRFSG